MPRTLHILPRFLYACTLCTLTPCALLLLAIITSANLTAQPIIDTIRANPAAVQLRQIWTLIGKPGDELGEGSGGVGDINGDNIQDFCLFVSGLKQCQIFLGSDTGISKKPAYILNNYSMECRHPITGNFWGDKSHGFGLSRQGSDIYMFRIWPSQNFDTIPYSVLDTRLMSPYTRLKISEGLAYDLDGDGADELILYTPGSIRGSQISYKPEVWIYCGGPGFSLDTPTVILHDTEDNDGGGFELISPGHWSTTGTHLDIMTVRRYAGHDYKTKFWFASSDSPWSWNTPDKSVNFGSFDITTADLNGDNLMDIVAPPISSNPSHFPFYLSGNTKDIITRDLTINDVDKYFYHTEFDTPFRLGYLNDSLRRYQMLGLSGRSPIAIGMGSGPGGLDNLYDTYSGNLGVVIKDIGDATGDGWDEILESYYDYNGNQGIAKLFSGGPYIPRDPSVGVRDIPVSGEDKPKLFCWPVPMHDQLNIAWHGDMKRFPHSFRVHDNIGRLVATGQAEPYKGSVLWTPGPQVSSGSYVLSIYDRNGALLGSRIIIKE